MNSWFLVRRYPDDLNGSEMKKFKLTSKNRNAKRYKSLKAVASVMTSYPKLTSMNKVILRFLGLLYMAKEIQISSFQTTRKHSSYLLRAKIYPIERTVGAYKYGGKGCEVCINVHKTSIFTSTVIEETRITNHKFDCNEKCLVYILTCNKWKIQHIGKAIDQFRSRWNYYKYDSRKHSQGATCMQQHFSNHFCISCHYGFLEDLPLKYIDKTDPYDPLKREDYWRSTLKVMGPFGFNI